MNSPVKYHKNLIPLYTAGGIILALIALLLAPHPLTIAQYLVAFSIVPMFAFMGWAIRLVTSTIFHREVDHPITINDLKPLQVCWLNGQTPVIYLGLDDYTGQLKFHIKGIHPDTDLEKGSFIYPGQARQYISDRKEV